MRSPNPLIRKPARFNKSSAHPVFCSETFINMGIHIYSNKIKIWAFKKRQKGAFLVYSSEGLTFNLKLF